MKKFFKNRQFMITPQGSAKITLRRGVFVPDEKTGMFIKAAIKLIKKYKIDVIADIGTGSGIIAIWLAKVFPEKKIYAYDISKKALRLARYNVSRNRIVNISLFKNKKDIWINSPISKKIDMVISNPPYVGNNEYFSKVFQKEYPDAKYQPIRAIRSYDRYGFGPYVGIFNAAKKHNIKYIFFRCNTKSIDKINLVLSKLEHPIKVKKIKSKKEDNSFMFIERLS